MRHRLLTEQSTPHDVAIVDDLISRIRLSWLMACAWERVDPGTYSDGFSHENPYREGYHAAVQGYENYRENAR